MMMDEAEELIRILRDNLFLFDPLAQCLFVSLPPGPRFSTSRHRASRRFPWFCSEFESARNADLCDTASFLTSEPSLVVQCVIESFHSLA